jgi:putative alpha-1,2-mannosidase
MAKPGADTDSPDNQGGFAFDRSNITGFSSLHDSGTGGSPSLGLFPVFAHPECPGDDLDRCVFPKKVRKIHYAKDSVKSTPGYFGLRLVNNISVDMTATHHASLFRFQFPTNGKQGSSPLILLDLTDLSDSRQDNGTISVDPKSGRMAGGARFNPSFGQGTYLAYFCADFKGGQIRDNGIFVNSRASVFAKDLTISRSINGYPLPGGAFVRFHPTGTNPVLVRVGVSFLNSNQACQNAEKEIPDYNFDAVKTAAESKWRTKIGRIRVSMNKVNLSVVKNLYR